MADIAQLQKMRENVFSDGMASLSVRKDRLLRLRKALLNHEQALNTALHQDLRKSREEVWASEIGMVIAELNEAIGSLKKWMAPKRVGTNFLNWPSKSYLYNEPLGLVLIIAPWNYPVQLLFNPLIGALAAGNLAVLKPSEFTPATEEVMRSIVQEAFTPEEVLYVTGDGAVVVPDLLQSFTFDHVFYTGSTSVGRLVYKMAADRLVPVTLELGGKSPTVVESDANLRVAAKRIAAMKFLNCGQTCVAPDYILVHRSVHDRFIEELKAAVTKFYSQQPKQSESFGRIVNTRQFDRLVSYLGNDKILFGGGNDRSDLYIEPTLLTNVSLDSAVMNEEIFGPVVSVMSFDDEADAIAKANDSEFGLSGSIWTNNSGKAIRVARAVESGNLSVNSNSSVRYWTPFGGYKQSGLGRELGPDALDSFTEVKNVFIATDN